MSYRPLGERADTSLKVAISLPVLVVAIFAFFTTWSEQDNKIIKALNKINTPDHVTIPIFSHHQKHGTGIANRTFYKMISRYHAIEDCGFQTTKM